MLRLLSAALLVCTGAACSGGARPGRPVHRRVVAYVPSWTDRDIVSLDVGGVTEIVFAFADVSLQGTCVLEDPSADPARLAALRRLRGAHPGLHTLLSIGGAGSSAQFSAAAATINSRRALAASCVSLAARYGVDGLDVDWEFPVSGGATPGRPGDRANCTVLLRELRSRLDALGPGHPLSVAVPLIPQLLDNFQLADVAATVDWMDLMAYDAVGAATPATGFNAPLYAAPGDTHTDAAHRSGQAAVEHLLEAGVPAKRIVLGVPFYGRGWQHVPATGNGLFQPPGRAIAPTSYDEITRLYLPQATRYWSDAAQVPWLFDRATGTWITYDDARSIKAKAAFARARHLGGVMIWTLVGDDERHTLVDAVNAGLRGG